MKESVVGDERLEYVCLDYGATEKKKEKKTVFENKHL
jgi:hypothetical protein